MAQEDRDEAGAAPEACDVLVIGGAFAGAACALLLRRWLPERRIVVVERRARFDRKVGEATVEISALFLHRVLGLHDHLARDHLPKHGLRFWFADRPDRSLHEMSEVGSYELPRLPSFQLDRARLDEHLLALAADAGCEVLRPARVEAVDGAWPAREATLRTEDGERRIAARWIVDASGREGFLPRLWKLRREEPRHPTHAMWARWRGVLDLDGPEVMGPDARAPRLDAVSSARRLATNHFGAYGCWWWVIPLGGGETSIGLVYDSRHFDPGLDAGPREAYRRLVTSAPGLRELVAGARMDEDDFHLRRRLAYTAERYADRGWALVGDSASFTDPYYSPGLDHGAMSVYATARLIEDDLRGRLDEASLEARLARHNGEFARSYERWLSAVYTDKYELMGDAELVRIAFLADSSLYYLGVVGFVVRDLALMAHPPFGLALPQAKAMAAGMALLKRRLVSLARFRRRAGLYGRRNLGWRARAPAFGLGSRSFFLLLRALAGWVGLEAEYARHRLLRGAVDVSRPVAEPEAAALPRRRS